MVLPMAAQQSAGSAASIVPPYVSFSGVLQDGSGKPLSGVVGVTFSLYKDPENGVPLWMEVQNVYPDAGGHYTVMLGAATSSGLPGSLFAAGEARWLGVQVQGQSESARVMLLAVPYALKAGDAQTIGGLPPSAFVLASPTAPTAQAAGAIAAEVELAAVNTACASLTSDGTAAANQVSKFTAPCNIEPSAITENSGKVGIGTSTPVSTLDVKGGATIRGTLVLPATGTATATAGKDSQPLTTTASSFNSGTAAAVSETFQLQAEPAGNDTANPSGTLNLLFGSGGTPAETGLNIASNGVISFAAGQTFPGAGTITGVTAGTGLTGGGTSGNVTVSVGTNACLAGEALTGLPFTCATFAGLGANAFKGNQSVTGNVTATGSISSGAATFNGKTTTQIVSVTQTGAGNGINASTATTAGSAIMGNTTATTGNINGVFGVTASPTGNGVLGSNNATTGFAVGVTGTTSSASGAGVNGFNSATSGAGVGVVGSSASPSGIGVSGTAMAGGGSFVATATSGVATGVFGQISAPAGNAVAGFSLATNGTAGGVLGQIASTSDGATAVFGSSTGTSGVTFGVQGSSNSGTGVGVQGVNNGSGGGNGVAGFSNATTGFGDGVYGQSASTSGNGVFGNESATSGFANGVDGQTSSENGNGVFGINSSTTTGNGVSGSTAAANGDGVAGFATATSGNGVGVFGQTFSTNGGVGVYGFAAGANGLGEAAENTALNVEVALAGPSPTVISAYVPNGGPGLFSVDTSGNGFFAGNLNVAGSLSKGGGSFKIDDPLDPAHKYLSHSFVESPDMMNVYNGNVRTDRRGFATVVLPDYFEILNRDFRYQLTVIGEFAQAIVAKEIRQNRFTIRTSKPGVKVSWQVTGIRQDAYANAYRIPVEEEKPANEQGKYLHPELFGASPAALIGAVAAARPNGTESAALRGEK
jgi:trimeric autotransporter adhesin